MSSSSYVYNNTKSNSFKKVFFHNIKMYKNTFKETIKSFIGDLDKMTELDPSIKNRLKDVTNYELYTAADLNKVMRGYTGIDFLVETNTDNNKKEPIESFDIRHLLFEYFFNDRFKKSGNNNSYVYSNYPLMKLGIGFDTDDIDIDNDPRNPLNWIPFNTMGEESDVIDDNDRNTWIYNYDNEGTQYGAPRTQLAVLKTRTSLKTYPEMYIEKNEGAENTMVFNNDWIKYFKFDDENKNADLMVKLLKNQIHDISKSDVENLNLCFHLTDLDKLFAKENGLKSIKYISTCDIIETIADKYDSVPNIIDDTKWSVINLDINDKVIYVDYVLQKKEVSVNGEMIEVIGVCPNECLITETYEGTKYISAIKIPSYNYLIAQSEYNRLNEEGEQNRQIFPYNGKLFGTYYYYYNNKSDSPNGVYDNYVLIDSTVSDANIRNITIFDKSEESEPTFFRANAEGIMVGCCKEVEYEIDEESSDTTYRLMNDNIDEITKGVSRIYSGDLQSIDSKDITDSLNTYSKLLKSSYSSLWNTMEGCRITNENRYSQIDDYKIPFFVNHSEWLNTIDCEYDSWNPIYTHFYIDGDSNISYNLSHNKYPNNNFIVDNDKLYLGNYMIPPINFFNSSENLLNINENIQKSIALLKDRQINDNQSNLIDFNNANKSLSREGLNAVTYDYRNGEVTGTNIAIIKLPESEHEFIVALNSIVNSGQSFAILVYIIKEDENLNRTEIPFGRVERVSESESCVFVIVDDPNNTEIDSTAKLNFKQVPILTWDK